MKAKKKNIFQLFFSYGETARFQTICMLITATLVSLFFFSRIAEKAVIADPYPKINFYLPQTQSNLESRVAHVATGLSIRNFSEFDTINNRFAFDGIIWFKYNPIMVTLDTISKFSFQKGKFVKKSPPDVKMIGNLVLVRFDITVEFTTSLDQRFFPFDDHRIDLMLINEFVTYDELIYTAKVSNFTISPDIYASGYRYLDKQVEFGYLAPTGENSDATISTNSVVLFSMEFGRAGVRKPILIVIPLVLMLFVSLSTLTCNPVEESVLVLSLALTSLPAVLAYRFVIETISPAVGYSTISDHLYSFVLAVSFITFIITSFYTAKGTLPIDELFVRKGFMLLCYTSLIILLYYLFFIWGR